MAKVDSKVKTFQGLGLLLKKTAATVAEGERTKPAPRRVKLTPADIIPPKAPGKTPKGQAPMDLTAHPFKAEINLLMDNKLDEALAMVQGKLKNNPGNLQLLTVIKLLTDVLAKGEDNPTLTRLLLKQTRNVLSDEDAPEQMDDLRQDNNFEMGVTVEVRADKSKLRAQLAKVDECIDGWELLAAAEIVTDLINDGVATPAARKVLAKLFLLLKGRIEAEHEDPEEAAIRPRKAKIEEASDWKAMVSDATILCLTFDEAEEERLDLSKLHVELPIDVHRPRIIEGIPLVIDMDGQTTKQEQKAHKLRHIVNYVWSYTSSLVGVPSEGDTAKEYQRAKAYAAKKGLYLREMPLRRPDSDATWFPIIPFENVTVRSVGFPDMVHATKRHTTDEEYRRYRQQAVSIRLRAQREAFESTESVAFTTLEHLRGEVSDSLAISNSCGEQLKEKFGRADVPEATIVGWFTREIEYQLRDKTDLSERWSIRMLHRRQQAKYVELWDKRAVAMDKARRARRQIKDLELQIAARKEIVYPSARQATLQRFKTLTT